MKRLKKSINNVMISGVCGGIGEYFGIDPTIVRVIYALIAIFSFGTAVLIYIVLAIIIPRDDGTIDV